MDSISAKFANMSGREIVLATLTVITLLTYMTYIQTFQPLLLEIDTAENRLAELEKSRLMIEKARGSITKLGTELIRLKEDLAGKTRQERKLNNKLSSGGHTDTVLKSLENSARNLKLELLELNTTSTTAHETTPLVSETIGDKRFTKNAIKLKYRSSYPAGVDYLARMSEIPYALSIISVEMTPSYRVAHKQLLVTTSVEIELFSK